MISMELLPSGLQPLVDYEVERYEIPDGLEAILRRGEHLVSHAGYTFSGCIWFDAQSGTFKESVWKKGRCVHTLEAKTLGDVVNAAMFMFYPPPR